MVFITGEKLQEYAQQENIHFVKTDDIYSFLSVAKNLNDIILITGLSDYPITEEIYNSRPNNIKYWFAQNCDVSKEALNIQGIPCGVNNTKGCPNNGYHDHYLKHIPALNTVQKNNNILASFALSTNPQRTYIKDMCSKLEWVDLDCVDLHHQSYQKDFDIYLENLKTYKMTISPEGNGVDCIRTWEAIYMGVVPIVKRSNVTNWFEDSPIIFLDEWEQLKDKGYIFSEYNRVKNNSPQMADHNFWKQQIDKQLKLL